MAENEKLTGNGEVDEINEVESAEDSNIFTLTDEETGKEEKYEIIGSYTEDGKTYYAMTSAEEESEEYVILRVESEEDDSDDVTLVTVDDDDEFERVAAYFDNELFSEIDYDEEDGESK